MPTPSRVRGEVSARRHNLSLVLRLLTDEGPRSRAGIADATGLTRATSSNLVEELAARGLVADAGTVRGTSGRPATLVAVAPDSVSGVAVVIDVDEVRAAAMDLTGTLRHLSTRPLGEQRADPAAVTREVTRAARAVRRRMEQEGARAVGLTVAVPGLVTGDAVVAAPNLGWDRVALRPVLAAGARRAGYDGPVSLENEANLAARAEVRSRPGRSFILVSAGVGIGAGVVADGTVFRGAHGFGGELGHFVVDPGGRRCGCGNRGCLETVAGQRSLMRACGVRSRRAPDASWVDRAAEAAAHGVPRVLAALDDVGDALAVALSAAVSLFDPEAIVLGGYLTAFAPWVAPRIEAQLQRQVLGSRYVAYTVEASAVGPAASMLGAGWAALAPVLADPLLVPPLPLGR